MADRDWLGELGDPRGDDAPVVPEHDQEAWARQLDAAFGEAADDTTAPEPPPAPAPVPADGPRPEPVPAAPVAAIADVRPLLDPLDDRLSRIEALLAAGFERSQAPEAEVPSPVVDADLTDRLAALHEAVTRIDRRLDEQGERLAQLPTELPAPPPPVAPVLPDPVDLTDVLARLDALAYRIDALAAVAEEPLPSDPAVERLSAVVEDRLEHLAKRVDALAAMAEEPLPPDPAVARFASTTEERYAHLSAQLGETAAALLERVAGLEGAVEAVSEGLAGDVDAGLARTVDAVRSSGDHDGRMAELAEQVAAIGDRVQRLDSQLLDELRAKLDAAAVVNGQQIAQLVAAIDTLPTSVAAPIVVGEGDDAGAAMAEVGRSIVESVDKLRMDIAASRIDLDADQMAKSLSSLGRRILALEQMQANAMAVDERSEMRLRELLQRLEHLAPGQLG